MVTRKSRMKQNEMAGNSANHIAELALQSIEQMAKGFGIKYSRALLRSACEGAVYYFNDNNWGRNPMEDQFGAYAAAVERGLEVLRDFERKEREEIICNQ